ncbi:hypothetical protein A3860_11840 [Niastella vici]|uniref:Short-chain dehydrogenase n=1 Tax=Niastella vici TaxID=1703345 RepID=A0A1V9FG47_9BACT|nr:SDR family NAD(P)-dependent oxidoreductase [Niastella vici]OQP57241.1 hypothetical protein A3860_11840 [Niastella vici]
MKTVIITGANGNLGMAVTETFLKNGYQVIATVMTESDKKNMLVHEQLEVHALDLTNEQEVSSFVQTIIKEKQQVHAALMLAGGFALGNIAATSGAVLQKQFALNFETAYYLARPLFQHMLGNGFGRLIFIGARPALQPADGHNMIAYALSKSLLFTLAGQLNEEAKGKNVTATVVVPSTIDTPLNRKNMPDANPANWVTPCQLADILEFVVSEKGAVLREPVIKAYNNS